MRHASSEEEMASQGRGLPDFDSPPVTETVLDVAFAPLQNWRIPHFGLFWQTIKKDYPEFADQPPVILQRERFGDEKMLPRQLAFEILQGPEARCWFISNSRLIQIQNDRFIQNWRKIEGQEPYPHYDSIRPAFEYEWTRFCEFLSRESLGSPEIQQCEIQYINHIELQGWQTYADLVEALAIWPGSRANSSLPKPEDIAVNTTYLLPNNRGRLRVNMQSAIRNSDGKRVIQLSLIVRGVPESSTTEAILSWFDYGRTWMIKAFASFSSEKMHTIWKRKD
jgi:uncharacterized protein (TIGR04255 family)